MSSTAPRVWQCLASALVASFPVHVVVPRARMPVAIVLTIDLGCVCLCAHVHVTGIDEAECEIDDEEFSEAASGGFVVKPTHRCVENFALGQRYVCISNLSDALQLAPA